MFPVCGVNDVPGCAHLEHDLLFAATLSGCLRDRGREPQGVDRAGETANRSIRITAQMCGVADRKDRPSRGTFDLQLVATAEHVAEEDRAVEELPLVFVDLA